MLHQSLDWGPGAGRLAAAGDAIMAMLAIFRSHGWQIPLADAAAALAHYLRFCALTEDDGLPVPKRHAIIHLLRDIPSKGSPRFYALWKDESLIKLLKKSMPYNIPAYVRTLRTFKDEVVVV